MDFLKKHYEKVLLGIMLAGLIGGLVFMLFFIQSDRQGMMEKSQTVLNPNVKDLTNLDTTVMDAATARLRQPYELDLETTNKLFNSMEWQKALDGTLILAAKKTGLQVAVVTNIAPLYTIISLDPVQMNDVATNYVVVIEHQAATTLAKRRPTRHYLSKGEKPSPSDPVALKEVNGPADNPTSLVLTLTDSGDLITVSKENPYRKVDAYSADFVYAPERKVFHAKRAGDKVSFGGVDYLVVDVNQNELILSDQSNQKKTSLPFVP
jgi:hypothetical protein